MKFILFITAAVFTSIAFGNQCDNNGLTTIWDEGAILCDLTGSDGYDSFPIVVLDHSGSCEQKLNSVVGKTLVITKSIYDSGRNSHVTLSIVDTNSKEFELGVGMYGEKQNTGSFWVKLANGKTLSGVCRPY